MINTLRANLEKLEVQNDVEVVLIADVEDFNLVKNPVKDKDKRKRWFIETHGIDYDVELDALEPDILRSKIDDAILDYIDLDVVKNCIAEEAECMRK